MVRSPPCLVPTDLVARDEELLRAGDELHHLRRGLDAGTAVLRDADELEHVDQVEPIVGDVAECLLDAAVLVGLRQEPAGLHVLVHVGRDAGARRQFLRRREPRGEALLAEAIPDPPVVDHLCHDGTA